MADGALLEPNGCSSLMLECPKAEYLLNGSKQLADEIQERPDKRFDCVGQDFKCCLQVSLHETILQVSKRLGKLMKCPSSELVLICKGKVVSSHPMFSLEALDLFDSSSTCKLLVLQRPPGPAWIPFSRGGHPSAARHPPPPPSSDLAAALPALRAPAGLRARTFLCRPPRRPLGRPSCLLPPLLLTPAEAPLSWLYVMRSWLSPPLPPSYHTDGSFWAPLAARASALSLVTRA